MPHRLPGMCWFFVACAAEAPQSTPAPDPVQSLAELRADFQIRGDAAGDRCPPLAPGPLLDECLRLAARPHLRQPDAGPGDAKEAGRDPKRGDPAEHSLGVPWGGIQPRRNTTIAAVPPGCADRTEDRDRADCVFVAAEDMADPQDPDSAKRAIATCGHAATFVDECVDHVAAKMAASAPPWTGGSPADWDRLQAGLDATLLGIRTLDPALHQDAWRSLLTARAAEQAVRTAVPGAAPSPHVPADWAPHVRASVAARLWSSGAPPSLDEGAAALLGAETQGLPADTPTDPPTDAKPHAPTVDMRQRSLSHTWETLAGPAEAALPRGSLRGIGTAWRAMAPSEGDDRRICVVETAGRHGEAGQPVLTQALADPHPATRWTALRLWQAQDPALPLPVDLSQDAEPLITERLGHTAPAQGPPSAR